MLRGPGYVWLFLVKESPLIFSVSRDPIGDLVGVSQKADHKIRTQGEVAYVGGDPRSHEKGSSEGDKAGRKLPRCVNEKVATVGVCTQCLWGPSKALCGAHLGITPLRVEEAGVFS